jgi:hypothetical protein
VLKTTGKPYATRDAYTALDSRGDDTDMHGRRVWDTRLPNKVKIFAWLFFKNRLSTKDNLHAKHAVENTLCQRCGHPLEDRSHVFFECPESAALWRSLSLQHATQLSDEGIWAATPPRGLDRAVWPFILLTILWRIWDGRNGEVFRGEAFLKKVILKRVCDDFVI